MINSYSTKLRQERKDALAQRINLNAETVEFNLRNLKSALTNIDDTIDALKAEPPRVASALSNAKSTKTAIKNALDDYEDDYDGPRVGYRRSFLLPNPPAPPAPPGPVLNAETETFNLKNLKSALTNINDTIDALVADSPRIASALSNAKATKTAIENAIDGYDDEPNYRGVRAVRVVTNPSPPPPGMSGKTIELAAIKQKIADRKAKLIASGIDLDADVETFNLGKLKSARGNVEDTINALEADPPKVASALSNARAAKKTLDSAIDTYSSPKYKGVRVVRVVPDPSPPPPPPPGMASASLSERVINFSDQGLGIHIENGEITITLDEEAPKKSEDGVMFPAEAYAYTPMDFKPSTWKLRLWATPTGGPDAGIVGAAVAALGKGFRGNRVEIPVDDLPGVKVKVRAAWIKANPDKKSEDMPSVIKASAEGTISIGESNIAIMQGARASVE